MTEAKTRVEPIRARLRSEILSGALAPGSKLGLSAVASRMGATMGVAREALLRLASEGMVVSEPQQGFRVTPVSERDLRDLVETRCVVECEAFRQSIRRGGLAWEGDVIAAYHRLSRLEQGAGSPRDHAAWVDSHRHFHEVLLAACDNARLTAVSMTLRDAAELYRAASVGVMTPAQCEERDREHLALRDAAVQRDELQGSELLEAHIRRTAQYFSLTT